MEKLYNDVEYSNKAIEANNEKKALYVYVHTTDYDVEVLEWFRLQLCQRFSADAPCGSI